jgi:hypothetical protein
MAGGWINEEDEEDFEQEKKIRDWLNESGSKERFEFKSINREGNARHIGVAASFSLDQKVGEDTDTTFADVVAGSDGRDLFGGENAGPTEYLDWEQIQEYLEMLGMDEGLTRWVTKTLKWSVLNNKSLFRKLLTDLEL